MATLFAQSVCQIPKSNCVQFAEMTSTSENLSDVWRQKSELKTAKNKSSENKVHAKG